MHAQKDVTLKIVLCFTTSLKRAANGKRRVNVMPSQKRTIPEIYPDCRAIDDDDDNDGDRDGDDNDKSGGSNGSNGHNMYIIYVFQNRAPTYDSLT